MNKMKLLLTLALAFAFLLAQVGNVAAAAPLQTSTSLTGTVVSITPQPGGTTVVVELKDDQGTTHTVTLSTDTAASLGLLVLDPTTNQPVLDPVTGLPEADLSKVNQSVTINSTDIVSDTTQEQKVNPISALLGAFFGEDASVIDGYHQDGFGFGVIAQALWMSKNLNGDASLTSDILKAKQTGDYSAFFPAGTTDIPANWGQFKKELLNKHNNLGNVVSGHANDEDTSHPGKGNGNGNGQGNGKGNNNGQGGGNGNGNGNKP